MINYQGGEGFKTDSMPWFFSEYNYNLQ